MHLIIVLVILLSAIAARVWQSRVAASGMPPPNRYTHNSAGEEDGRQRLRTMEDGFLSWHGHLQVFAPLARRLGLYPIKEELEELGFKYSDPDNYKVVRQRMDELANEHALPLEQAKPFHLLYGSITCVFTRLLGEACCSHRSMRARLTHIPARTHVHVCTQQHVARPDLSLLFGDLLISTHH